MGCYFIGFPMLFLLPIIWDEIFRAHFHNLNKWVGMKIAETKYTYLRKLGQRLCWNLELVMFSLWQNFGNEVFSKVIANTVEMCPLSGTHVSIYNYVACNQSYYIGNIIFIECFLIFKLHSFPAFRHGCWWKHSAM
jgi:hypothetical protein